MLYDGARQRGEGSLRIRIRRTSAGVNAIWFAHWKKAGERGKKQLGRFPDMSLAEARAKFTDEIRPLVKASPKPKIAIAHQNETPTVENLFIKYVAHLEAREAGSAPHVKHALLSGKYNAADQIGRSTLAGDVTPSDVRKPLVAAAKRKALRTADIQRTCMSAAFGWGMRAANDYTQDVTYDWGITSNPVAAVPKDPRANKARDRNLSPEEMAAVWANLTDEGSGDCARLVMLCGQRVQETIKVDGREVDTARALWTIPAKKTKGRKHQHIIPLPPQANEIFKRLKRWHGDGPLFPARTGSKAERMGFLAVSHHIASLKCCDAFQARDLRRTWKSRMGDGALVDRFTRDLLQQHARKDAGGIHYDHTDYLPQMRTAMVKWGKWFEKNVAQVAKKQRKPQDDDMKMAA
ncbi:tyrosine-type recombinase/integrase [Tardiphaga sp. 20_F10_N6_6]|uniref:tyrosine-type recombinase/integrase n=1 Tax=Tardiphaga sp. 20_F10_N6_6 TaxID=3240788 RepID=UPI003F897C88